MNPIDMDFIARLAAPALVLVAVTALYVTYRVHGGQRHVQLFILSAVLVLLAMINQALDVAANPLRSPTISNSLYLGGMGLCAYAIVLRTGKVLHPVPVMAGYLITVLQVWFFEVSTPLPYARIAIVNFSGAAFFLLAAGLTRPQLQRTRADKWLFWSTLAVGLYLLPRGLAFVAISLVTDFESLLYSPLWIALQLQISVLITIFVAVAIWCNIQDLREQRSNESVNQV